jgi:hypothetical protein
MIRITTRTIISSLITKGTKMKTKITIIAKKMTGEITIMVIIRKITMATTMIIRMIMMVATTIITKIIMMEATTTITKIIMMEATTITMRTITKIMVMSLTHCTVFSTMVKWNLGLLAAKQTMLTFFHD